MIDQYKMKIISSYFNNWLLLFIYDITLKS